MNMRNFLFLLRMAVVIGLALPVYLFTAPAHSGNITKTSSFEYNAAGLLVKETIEPDRPQDCLETTYGYDSFGNQVWVASKACVGATGDTLSSASAPRAASSSFGSTGLFPVSTTNALGHTETKQYDSRFGTLTSLTGPNGLNTTWAYDSLGRKTRENSADGTSTTWAYLLCTEADAHCPATVGPTVVRWVVHQARLGANGAPMSAPRSEFHDGAGRILRVQTGGFDGSGVTPLIAQDTEYDSIGRVSRRSNAYSLVPSGTQQWTTYTYDPLDRVLTETTPDSAAPGGVATTTSHYSGLSATVTNAKGQTRTTTRNAQGQITSVADTDGQRVTYLYDAAGQLRQTDAAGAITSITYTQRGQKSGMQDPSMGSWTYAYNAFGDLVRQQDSLSQTTTMAYDVLGRMVQRAEPDLTSTWFHDRKADGTQCGASIGKLCEARANNGYQRIHTYDGQGRNSSTATLLDNASSPAIVSLAFDPNTGRVASKTWPTGFQASFSYTADGFLKRVSSGGTNGFAAAASLDILAMDAQGHITQYRQGSKVVTQRSYDDFPGNLRSQQVTVDGQAAGNALNHTYTYDALRNLIGRTDINTGTQEQFSYDALNRLTLYGMSSGAVSQGITQVMYDPRGNITYKSDVGSYGYDPQRPNRVNSITPQTAPGAQVAVTGTRELAYAFDDTAAGAKTFNSISLGNGNLINTVSRDTANNRNTVRQEKYTSFNMPRNVVYGNFISSTSSTPDRTLDFVYGPEHQRIRQQVQLGSSAPSSYEAGTTWYLNGEDSLGLSYEKEVTTSGRTDHKHYLSAAGIPFAMFVSRTGNLGDKPATDIRYLHQDHLGSVSAVTDADGTVVERMAYDPWGKRQNLTGATDKVDALVGASTDRGYTMHEHLDEIGVVNMNGRIYDSLVGRFMSADPFVQDPYDLQNFNRYAYVLNGPLSKTDPTGYCTDTSAVPCDYHYEPGYGNGGNYGFNLGTITVTGNRVDAEVFPGTISGGVGAIGGGGVLMPTPFGPPLLVPLPLLPITRPPENVIRIGTAKTKNIVATRIPNNAWQTALSLWGQILDFSPMRAANALGVMMSHGTNSTPPVPGDLVGDQSDPRAGTSNNGKRHTSGPLTPENGGTGDAEKDFDRLTGGTGKPFPGSDDRSKISGAQVGDNGVWIRLGTKNSGDGPRIEIPGNGNKLPETLHY